MVHEPLAPLEVVANQRKLGLTPIRVLGIVLLIAGTFAVTSPD
jgi:hypothetical protein